jgi:hypothetical protein
MERPIPFVGACSSPRPHCYCLTGRRMRILFPPPRILFTLFSLAVISFALDTLCLCVLFLSVRCAVWRGRRRLQSDSTETDGEAQSSLKASQVWSLYFPIYMLCLPSAIALTRSLLGEFSSRSCATTSWPDFRHCISVSKYTSCSVDWVGGEVNVLGYCSSFTRSVSTSVACGRFSPALRRWIDTTSSRIRRSHGPSECHNLLSS